VADQAQVVVARQIQYRLVGRSWARATGQPGAAAQLGAPVDPVEDRRWGGSAAPWVGAVRIGPARGGRWGIRRGAGPGAGGGGGRGRLDGVLGHDRHFDTRVVGGCRVGEASGPAARGRRRMPQ
jgi:hypothetical protein